MRIRQLSYSLHYLCISSRDGEPGPSLYCGSIQPLCHCYGMETEMKKMKLMCVALMLPGSIPSTVVWADRGHGHRGHHGHHHHGHHNHGHHHHRHGGGYGGYGLALGLGVLGYGLGYYGSRAPYYPPSYGYGYGYPPVGGYAPGYGYAPAYGYPPVVAAPPAPPAYIQQQEIIQVQPPAQASNYWHYCRNPEGYYPYVKKCPEGWLQVAPQPDQ